MSNSKRRPDLSIERLKSPQGDGPFARIWFRRLASDFWGPLLEPHWFHTWIELVDAEDRPLFDRPLSAGIYDKSVEGETRALLMSQSWEHGDEAQKKYRPGYFITELPGLSHDDIRLFHALNHDGQTRDLGPYSFICAWNDLFDHEKALNCMIWVEQFVVSRKGAPDILKDIGRAFSDWLAKNPLD